MCETAVEYRSVCRCIPKKKTVDSDNPKLNVLLLHSARAHRKSANAASPVAFMAFIAFIAWHECRGRVRTQQTADYKKKTWNSAYLLQFGVNTSWILRCLQFLYTILKSWIPELPSVERFWSISPRCSHSYRDPSFLRAASPSA